MGGVFYLLSPLYAQTHDAQFRRLSLEDGLSQNSVYCIFQDSKGFMWLGTEDGLNRYDGRRIKEYQADYENPHSISNNFVISIYEDRKGTLWIGTSSGGLNKFDRESENFTHYLTSPSDPNSLSQNTVTSICEDQSGILWIGTYGGLNAFDRKRGVFTRYLNNPDDPNSLSNNSVTSICQDKEGVLWIGTLGGGLNKFDPKKGTFVHYKADLENPNSLRDNRILSVYEDRSGTLWIGTVDGGLHQFDRTKERFISYQADANNPNSLGYNTVKAIYEDSYGAGKILWIGTQGGGLYKFDRERGIFIPYRHDPGNLNSISTNTLLCIYEDRSGVLWIGTDGGGVNRLDLEKKRFTLYRRDPKNSNSLNDNSIWAFCEDRSGTLWIGTHDGGLNRYDRTHRKFTHYAVTADDPNALSYNSIYAVYEDRAGILWTGTIDGCINRFDRRTGRYTHYQTDPTGIGRFRISFIYEDQMGTFWVGTRGVGLLAFDREKEEFIRYQSDPEDSTSLSSDDVYCIFEDKSGELWIGTIAGGLNKYDRKKNAFTRYMNDPENPKSLSDNIVLTIYEDQKGFLWIGGFRGLNKFNREKGIFTLYSKKDGLPNDVIYGILEDDGGNLWMSTNKGLSKFNPQKETFRNYDINDGLQSNEFNAGAFLKSRSGEMFFGGINGFNSFYPDSIRDNPYVPTIVIADLQISNTSVPIGKEMKGRVVLKKAIPEAKEIELSYKVNVFSFEFAALHYVSPEKNQYAYKMEGLEKEWNYVGNRGFVTYTNLSPGRYVFRVKGSNNDGVWNEEGVSLRITISHPFWQTWWFRVFGITASLVLILTVSQVRTRAIRERNKRLEKRIEERTAELKSASKKAQHRAAQASLIYEVGQRVSGELKLEALLSEIVTAVQEAFNYYGVMMLLLDKKGKRLNMQAIAGGYVDIFPKDVWVEVGKGMIGGAAVSGKAKLSGDVTKNSHFVYWADEKTKSELSVPIKSGEKVIGVLDIQSDKSDAFDETDVAAMETLSTQIATAIENARLYEKAQQEIAERKRAEKETHRRAVQAALIYEVGQRVSGELKLEALLSEIVTAVQEAFNYYTVGLLLCDEEAGRLTLQSAAGSYTDVFPEGLWLAIGEGMIGYAAAIGETQVSGDVRKDTHYVSKAGGETKSELSVPIKSGDRVVGVLDIQSDKSDAFDETDVAAMETLSTQIATAIENARLYEKAQQEIAERKRVEDALRESGTLLRSTLESIEDGILVVNEKGKITHSNARFSEMWRVPKKIMAAKNSNALLEFVKNQLKNPKEFLAKVGKLYETTEQDFDTLYFKDGRICERLSFPLVIDKKAQGRVWSFRDVTERTKAKEEIKRLKEFNEGIIQNMVGGIVVDNAAEKITFVNPAMMDILGYSYDELVGKHWKVLCPPDRHSLIEETNKLRMRGKSSRYEVEMLHKNGKRVPILVSGSPYFDNGHYGGTIAVIVDITELKRAEKELEKRQQYLESVLHDTPNAIVTTDSSFRVIEWNPGAEKIFGYTREEVLGKNIDDLVARSDVKEEAVALSEKHLSGERPSPLETVRYRKDGTPLNVIIAGSSIQVGGDIIGSVAVYTDITQRKLAEEASKQAELVQTTVYKIAASAHTVKSLEELFQSIHELIGILMPAKNFYIALHDPSTDLVHFPYYIDEYDQPPPPIKITEGLTGYVFRTGKPLLSTPEIAKELAATGEAKEMGASSVSWLGVPLKVENRVIGVLTVQSYEEDVRYGEEEKNILEFVSAQVAAAVHRKQAEEQIRASLQEKEMLLKEIHHRVKNNFQVISSLLHLQSRYIQDKTALNVFKESQDRIRSMALVHERLYQSKNLAKVDFNGYIEMLAKGLFRSYGADPKRISLITEVRDIALGIDIAIPCGLIVNELVSNSLKYGFPEGWKGKGEIRIALSQKNGFIDLVVSDNGVGLPEGLDIRNTESLGLRLVALLAEDQLQGKMTLGKKKGTQFHIQFKE